MCACNDSSLIPQVLDNLSRQEIEALKQLEIDKEISILKADKGNCTVIMNRKDYEKKLLQLLTDTKTYKHLTKDPTPALQRKMNKVLLELMQSKHLPEEVYKKTSMH